MSWSLLDTNLKEITKISRHTALQELEFVTTGLAVTVVSTGLDVTVVSTGLDVTVVSTGLEVVSERTTGWQLCHIFQ